MKKNPASKSGSFNPRVFLAFFLCAVGAALGTISFTLPTPSSKTSTAATSHALIRPALVDIGPLPPVLKQSIIATFDWIASFGTPSAPKRMLARRAAGNAGAGPQYGQPLMPLVSEVVAATVSPPVRDLPRANQFSAWTERPEEGVLPNRTRQGAPNSLEHDPVVQTAAPTVGMPPVGVSFEGMDITQGCGNCLPPDTNGAVGPNHYVQMVNTDFAIYDKTGATLLTPRAINTLWALTPNSECATHNNGDPIVLYDQLADRWLISQFAIQASTENYAQCIAISQTPDPTGAYWLYEFDESADTFHDYPHLGVWPDGYYMSTNLFPNSALLFSTGAGAWVFERPKMLLGQAAKYVYFDETALATNTYTPGGQLPANLDGRTLPPTGTPGYFVEVDDANTPNTPPATGLHDEMHIWQFHVDWNNPANSTFGIGSTAPAAKPGFPGQYAGNAGQPNFIIPIADFVKSGCQIENGPNDCSPEKVNPPQPAQYLDVLGDRLMHRLTYRNFGDHESLVVNHTVDAAADQPMGVARNGVRWYEVRNLSTTPTVYQQGTFAPFDPTSLNGPLWRWMGSAAMDHSGNLAIGYSASGPNYFPSLHYAGRLVGDPPGALTQGEAVMFAGLGIEANTGIFPFRNRWGDYSAITVDPNDDCTFWYTNEYLAPNAPTDILPVDWHTRVGSFRFPTCVPPPLQLQSVVSRKTHGTAGTFDVNLPLTGTRGIECRTGGTSGNHKLVFTFLNALTSVGGVTVAGSSGNPMVGPGSDNGINPSDPHQYIVNLTGVDNAQYITISFNNVHDVAGNVGSVSDQMGVLLGDTTADGSVNSADIGQTKSQSGHVVTTSNFREDVTVDGSINSADIGLVKSKSGTALPTPP
jgi:hypothetical protein